ncbi:fructose bisphosphate aldolase [Alphaproteobacteria bacterium KMM 3653]|uniref:fructose-bisphosphate aldolase n=1 Tax=Harenicola maris TaxID=2841044 RepID=A0AAP2CPV8_9RHOB|nr:fructose bisphosphate aldolase [Harenicola maris]
MANADQISKITSGKGFIAALDQSGGSSPKALAQYGIEPSAYSSDEEMFDLIHAMRARIVSSPAFTGDRVVGAILFEQTMEREIGGKPSGAALWEDNGVVPFLKVDKGLEDAANGVQLMKPMPGLDDMCKRAVAAGIFGTKMRAVVGAADAKGIDAIIAQQFEIGAQIASHGLMPILEPEVTISIADKAKAEAMLRDAVMRHLDALPKGEQVMLKITLPEEANHYAPVVDHPAMMRVVALSGGYDLTEANDRLARNRGIIASFSRALTAGLTAQQSEAEFDAALDRTIQCIYDASVAG